MTEEARAAGLPEDMAGIFRLDGQRTIVTGAASGLGKAIALGFAHFGADVACLDIDPEGSEKTAAESAARGGAPPSAPRSPVWTSPSKAPRRQPRRSRRSGARATRCAWTFGTGRT